MYRKVRRGQVYSAWIVSHAAGGLLAGLVSGAFSTMSLPGPLIFLGPFVAMSVGGALATVARNYLYGALLRRHDQQLERPRGWGLDAVAWAAVAFLVFLLLVLNSMGQGTPSMRAMAGAGVLIGGCCGLAIGVLQWHALRSSVRAAGWWVLASTVGWAVTGAVFAASLVVAPAMWNRPVLWFALNFFGPLAGWLLRGAITGGAWVWLMSEPEPQDEPGSFRSHRTR